MRLNKLDLNLLTVLDILFQERSITRTATRVRLTQPAISNALKRLRAHFRDELFVTIGRRLHPTPFASEIEPELRDLIARARVLSERRAGFDPKESHRTFSINVSDYTALVLMLDVVRRLSFDAPGVVIELDSAAEARGDRFEAGLVDMIIVPLEVLSPGHPNTHLFDESYCCVAWQGNQALPSRLSLSDYLDCDHVVINRRFSRARSLEDAKLAKVGRVKRIAASSPDYTLLPQFVTGTNRIATVHRRLAERFGSTAELRILDLDFDLPVLSEHLQWHKRREHDPGTIWLRSYLKKAAASLG